VGVWVGWVNVRCTASTGLPLGWGGCKVHCLHIGRGRGDRGRWWRVQLEHNSQAGGEWGSLLAAHTVWRVRCPAHQVRADEACHSHVNHTFSSMKVHEPNPFGVGSHQVP
jgi:hypothetical protein